MITWVPHKNININAINDKITECILSKHLTNNGKNVLNLQKKIKDIFKISDDKEVLLTCNGAMGLNALVGGMNTYFNKQLKWVVQSFTFPCSNQGMLMNSLILDIDENMGPNINDLELHKEHYDGVIVTNCFGTASNIELYENFCKNNNKILLFDNAASSFTYYKKKNILNYGNGTMVSLHHTKPIGFGEGGFIIFDKKYLESMEKTICFGFTNKDKYNYNLYANNYKMSELACIYIDNYLINLVDIYKHHVKMIIYFIEKLESANLNNFVKLITNFANYNESLMSTIPILFNFSIDIDLFVKKNIEAKKYYHPLNINSEFSMKIFNNIICLPLNIDITFDIIDYYIDIINQIKHHS